MNSNTEEYLTMEFLNDLEIFDYDEFIRQYNKVKPKMEIFCMEFDPTISTKEFECAICMETQPEVESVVLKCKHKFCYSCVANYMKHKKQNHEKACCALCRETFTTMEITDYNHLLAMLEIVNP